ncbi:oxygenase MpaB family protein [Streptomyces avermitilis]|uniref:oxygenase MpaB family protein n=1 Tax=Streptomyces avermitilis TaxID=33903 RepID=UPI00367441F1
MHVLEETSPWLPLIFLVLIRCCAARWGSGGSGWWAWRLLVLQTADPAVAAGMSNFSTYRAHPWRRIEHTMDSGKRLFFSDREGLRREVARLERTHRRLAGTDEQGRPFTALDPAVRVWVLVTLYECMTAMRELSGRPREASSAYVVSLTWWILFSMPQWPRTRRAISVASACSAVRSVTP